MNVKIYQKEAVSGLLSFTAKVDSKGRILVPSFVRKQFDGLLMTIEVSKPCPKTGGVRLEK